MRSITYRRVFDSKLGRYAALLIAPLVSLPSDFVNRKTFKLFGFKVSYALWPLIPASIFGTDFSNLAVGVAKNTNWASLKPIEIVSITQNAVFEWRWIAFITMLGCIYFFTLMRWGWHFAARNLADRIRSGRLKTREAPWGYFVFHTSGLALWFAIFTLGFSFMYERDSQNAFPIFTNFLNANPGKVSFVCVLMIPLLYLNQRNSIRMTEEIYITKTAATLVRLSIVILLLVLLSFDMIYARLYANQVF